MFKKNNYKSKNPVEIQKRKIERIKKYYAKMNEDEEKVAKYVREKVIDWLSQADKTRHQIEEKIFKNIEPQHTELVNKILNEFEERGYISEKRFVENFLRIKHYDGFGETKIKNELKTKGINPEQYEHVFEEYDFLEAAREYIERKSEGKEYTEKEIEKLQRKMISRGFSFNQISPFIQKLNRKQIVIDDENEDEVDFSEARKFIQKKIQKGYGIQKIKQELKHKGLVHSNELFEEFDFFEAAKSYKIKKYGEVVPEDYNEKNKQKQHLLSRGFNFEQVGYAFE